MVLHAHWLRKLAASAVTMLCASACAAEQALVIMAGERPPYVGASLPEGGFVPELVSAALQGSGLRASFQYSAWARARLEAAHGRASAVLSTDCEDSADFVYSQRFFGGSIGLLKKRSLVLPPTSFTELASYRVGAVRDGVSLPAFEQNTQLEKLWAVSDLQNLDWLDQGKVQLALMDKYAAADLMASQRPQLIGQLEFVAPALAQPGYCLAFSRRTPHYQTLQSAFNSGLAARTRDGTLERIMNKHGLFYPRKAQQGKAQLVIGTVNNSDMLIMQQLAREFEARNPDVSLVWRVLDENTLRVRLMGDLAIADGQFDVMTIGSFELPIWARRGWLAPVASLPANYDTDDLLPTVRKLMTVDNQLYALPFYAESVMTYYRKDLFAKAGIEMPAQPSYAWLATAAARLHHPAAGVYGLCLRGKPGWGENMSVIGMLARAHGARWFGEDGQPELVSPAWHATVEMYAQLLDQFGPPHAERNGFNESLALFAQGHCALWVDATVAAGMLFDPHRSKVAGQLGLAPAPVGPSSVSGAWLWTWTLAIPTSSPHRPQAERFIAWATSRGYIRSVAARHGWIAVPPGTRKSTYASPQYLSAAPFAQSVYEAIAPSGAGEGFGASQYGNVFAFEGIGDRTGQEIARVLRHEQSVGMALRRAQNFALEQVSTGR